MDEELKLYCFVPPSPPREVPDGIQEERKKLVLSLDGKWVNGTTLTYYVFTEGINSGSMRQVETVRKAFSIWEGVGIGLKFKPVETIQTAMIRIGFKSSDGSWSYEGRQILDNDIVGGPKKRTMNIGWDNGQTLNTCLHTIGHTLGFPNEHQNPTAGIVWDEDAVYNFLGGPPNKWNRATIRHNIFRKIAPDEMQSSNWDKDSIMHYPFNRAMMIKPERYQTTPLFPAGGLSEIDKERALLFYPPMRQIKALRLNVDKPVPLKLDDGGQVRFNIRVSSSDKYDLFTSGETDTYIVLFEVQDDRSLKQLADDDDSGLVRNSSVTHKLQGDAEYVLQVRLYWMERGMIKEDPKVHLEISKGRAPFAGGEGSGRAGGRGSASGGSGGYGRNSGGGSYSGDRNERGAPRGSGEGSYDGYTRGGGVRVAERSDDSDSDSEKNQQDPDAPKSGCCVIL